jgi:hypothetical protein
VIERREKTEKSAGEWWTAQVREIKDCGFTSEDLDKSGHRQTFAYADIPASTLAATASQRPELRASAATTTL